MDQYRDFAFVYDELMDDVDYDGWVNYIEQIIKNENAEVKNILELACGTGNITIPLAKKNYDIAGIDISDDGSIVSISLVDYSDIKIKSSVLFYYTSKADAQSIESSDGLVSAIEVPEAIAAIVKFTPDNYCIVASDTSIMTSIVQV